MKEGGGELSEAIRSSATGKSLPQFALLTGPSLQGKGAGRAPCIIMNLSCPINRARLTLSDRTSMLSMAI